MKKFNHLFILPLACLFIFSGCSKDFLDKNPTNSVSSQTFWKSESDVRTALAGVYSRLQQNFLGYERVYFDAITDNAWGDPGNVNQPNLNAFSNGSINAAMGTTLNNMYSSPYRAITSCNYFLDNVDKAPISAALNSRFKGEVRFIRALCYFDLVQTFGDVVVNTKYPATVDEAIKSKSPKGEVYALIEEDLDYAIANLPDEKYLGNAVKGSAQGLKARVLITQKKWSQAVDLLQQIVSGGKFSLSNSYPNIFLTRGQTNSDVNREIMFSTRYLAPSNPQRTSPGAAGMDIELGWFSLIQPYQDLADEYEMIDGKRISESPMYDPANPYSNRDPRMNFTLRVPGETWYNSSGAAWTGTYTTNTGFLVEKYVDLSKAPFASATAQQTDQDFIHLRYADVLLMLAEAKNEATGPDASVYNTINQVRSRTGVNMPPVDQAVYNTKEELRDYIRHERRVEFAFEGQRYNDMKRWELAHVKFPTLDDPSGKPLVFNMNNYVLPFPQSELDNNPKLVQNQGY